MKSGIFHFPFFILHLVAIAGLVLVFGDPEGGSAPQVAQGGDVLSVAFGDAREVLSRALLHKADSYFHGGVDMECTLDHDEEGEESGNGAERHGEESVEGGEHEHHCHDGCCHHHHDSDSGNSTTHHTSLITYHSLPDPWCWLNSRIHAPEIERHLAGRKAVEMVPWLWASVRSDPHNFDAWEAAWYTAAHTMKDESLAQRILDEGLAKNPKSAELWFTQGRFRYKMGRGDLRAAADSFERARNLLLAACGGAPARLSEDDRRLYRFIGNYLQKLSAAEVPRRHLEEPDL